MNGQLMLRSERVSVAKWDIDAPQEETCVTPKKTAHGATTSDEETREPTHVEVQIVKVCNYAGSDEMTWLLTRFDCTDARRGCCPSRCA